MSLLSFSFDHVVSYENAKQDKIGIDYRFWKISSTTEDIDQLRNFMGVPPTDDREDDSLSLIYSNLFWRPVEHEKLRYPMKVRDQPVEIGGRRKKTPLFSGRWCFGKYAKPDLESPTSASTWLELWINPTRYVRHQSLPLMSELAPRGDWGRKTMFSRSNLEEIDDEYSLDGNDNWIPNLPRWQRFTNRRNWRRNLANYLEGIPPLFERKLQGAVQMLPDCDRSVDDRTKKIQLRFVETYFEFACANPTVMVINLKRLLPSFTRGLRNVGHFEKILDEEHEHNCLCISADINQGRRLRIYAKTNKRIRIEVAHTLSGVKKYRVPGVRVVQEPYDILPMLDLIAADATELVNEVLRHFQAQRSVSPSHISAFDLLTQICVHSRDAASAETIASVLVGIGAFAGGKGSAAMRKSFAALMQMGVLERSPRRVYSVNEPYRHAVRALASGNNLSILTARERTRI